jgi:hypothetical protein
MPPGESSGGCAPQGEPEVKMEWGGYGKNPEIPVKITGNTGSQRKSKDCSAGFILITIWNCEDMK